MIYINSCLYDPAPLFTLEMAKYRLNFIVGIAFPVQNIIPAVRSKLGKFLKKRFCSSSDYKKELCSSCLLANSCLYTKLFSPTNASIKQAGWNKGGNPPRPYGLYASVGKGIYDIKEGENISIELTLMGAEAIKYHYYFLQSIFQAAASINISNNNIRQNYYKNSLQSLIPNSLEIITPITSSKNQELLQYSENFVLTKKQGQPLSEWINAFPIQESTILEIELTTPFQLRRAKDIKITFPIFIQSIISRLRDLKRAYHMENNMGSFSKQFYVQTNNITTFSNLEQYHFEWYSYHRKKNIYLGGILGGLIFKGDITPFLPLLFAGFFTGIGRKTVYGLGHFNIGNV